MTDATFDGDNLHITLPNIGSFDTEKNIYSAWKEWIRQGDNAKYPLAFETTGGDAVGGGQFVAPYFFCRNDLGWRIKMPEADGEIVVAGNLFPRDPVIRLFEQTAGYDAFVRLEVSTRAVVVEVAQIRATPPVEDLTNLIVTLGQDSPKVARKEMLHFDVSNGITAEIGDPITIEKEPSG